jgi:hypothetical protein
LQHCRKQLQKQCKLHGLQIAQEAAGKGINFSSSCSGGKIDQNLSPPQARKTAFNICTACKVAQGRGKMWHPSAWGMSLAGWLVAGDKSQCDFIGWFLAGALFLLYFVRKLYLLSD